MTKLTAPEASQGSLATLARDGETFSGDVVLKGISIRQARNGSSFAVGTISDPSGSNLFRKFDTEQMEPGAYRVAGRYSEYNGSFAVILDRVFPLDNVNPDDLVYSPYDREELQDLLQEFLPTLGERGTVLAKVLLKGDDSGNPFTSDVTQAFFHEYAAVNHHDDVPSGLLAHSLKTARIVQRLLAEPMYGWDQTSIDGDLATVGALLHDLGKVFEYDHGQTSDMGRILSHRDLMVERTSMLHERIMEIPGMNADAFQRLLAIFSQHHGEYEETPRTGEAWLVHLADNLDARATSLADAFKENGSKHLVDGMYLS